MVEKVGFVAKVFGLAAMLAVLIKWVGPHLSIAAPGLVSLVLVLLPSLAMGLVLAWQAQRS